MTNPFSLLPGYVLILGRKLDNAMEIKAWGGWPFLPVCKEKLDKYPSNEKAKESASQPRLLACTVRGTQRVSPPPAALASTQHGAHRAAELCDDVCCDNCALA